MYQWLTSKWPLSEKPRWFCYLFEEVYPNEIANTRDADVLLVAVKLRLDGGSDIATALERLI